MSQWYHLCNYLKKLNNNKRGAVSNPLFEFKPDYNKKKICIFLVTIDLLKFWIVFNLQQWFYYFSHFCFSYLSKIVPRSHLYLLVFCNDLYEKFYNFHFFFKLFQNLLNLLVCFHLYVQDFIYPNNSN